MHDTFEAPILSYRYPIEIERFCLVKLDQIVRNVPRRTLYIRHLKLSFTCTKRTRHTVNDRIIYLDFYTRDLLHVNRSRSGLTRRQNLRSLLLVIHCIDADYSENLQQWQLYYPRWNSRVMKYSILILPLSYVPTLL